MPTYSYSLIGGAFGKSEYPPPAVSGAVIPAFVFGRDLYFGGNGRIVGTVKEKHAPADLPLARRVRLHLSRDGRCLAETVSSPDGIYTFDYIDPAQNYYTVAFDHLGNYRGVVADNLTPELM